VETYTIGELNESSLHKALKARYMEPELSAEVLFEGYVVDLLGKEEIIEIQTANFSGLKAKLRKLLDERDVRLVYPLPKDKWIVKLSSEGEVLSRRLSPKHCHFDDAFHELVYIAELLSRPNLKVEILLIQEEEIRVDDGRGSWRRKGVSIRDHRLLNVLSSVTLENPRDYLCFLPDWKVWAVNCGPLSVRNISLSESPTPRSKRACLRVLRASRAKALSPM
jgi:hypothetical protein